MKNNSKRILNLIFIFGIILAILSHPVLAADYAAKALVLWLEEMIPALFPFMILSGLIVRCNYGRECSVLVYPLLGRIYGMNREMCTGMILGFLFGYPLGAKTIAEQYRFHRITKEEASFLLAFCNNIGPIYMLGFALPLLQLPFQGLFLALHLLIPGLYGLLLRKTCYRKSTFRESCNILLKAADTVEPSVSFLEALDDAVFSACLAITRLGGYMIFFMVCNIISVLLKLSDTASAFISTFLEITSGLSYAHTIISKPLLLSMLTFGGLSCLAQTYTCIRETDLSFKSYVIHKINQTIFAFFLYHLCFFLLDFL